MNTLLIQLGENECVCVYWCVWTLGKHGARVIDKGNESGLRRTVSKGKDSVQGHGSRVIMGQHGKHKGKGERGKGGKGNVYGTKGNRQLMGMD